MEPKPLKIANSNNKLACAGFIDINFAPPHEKVKEKDFETIYAVQVNDKTILVRMVDFIRLPFYWIGSAFTIPATGLNSDEFKYHWLQRYPDTKADTEMAVYCYKEVKV